MGVQHGADTANRTKTLKNKTFDSSSTFGAVVVSASPTGDGVTQWATVTLTSAQVVALRATPITLVAAQTGKVLQFLAALLALKYGGSNGFTESTNNLQIKFTNGSGAGVSEVIEMTGFIDQTADTVTLVGPVFGAATLDNVIVATSAAKGAALVLHNTSGSEIAGNVAADNTLTVKVAFRAWTTP